MSTSIDPWEEPLPDNDVAQLRAMGVVPADEEDTRVPAFGSISPWWSVWVRPRETYRYLWSHVNHSTVVGVSMAAGIFTALDRASTRNAGENLSLTAILIASVLIGPLAGLLMLYLVSWLIGVTGRWMGGVGTSERVRFAMGWAGAMTITLGVLGVPTLALFGIEMFTEDMPSL